MKIEIIKALIYLGLIICILILSTNYLPPEEPSGCTPNYSVWDMLIPIIYIFVCIFLVTRILKILTTDDKNEPKK